MEKLKLKEEFKKHSFWWWILVIIVIIFFYNLFFNNTEEYTYCVKDCVFDNNECVFDAFPINSNYAEESDVNSCSTDLEYCVEECESNYG